MKKLTPIQEETMAFCKKQIDEARAKVIDLKKVKKSDMYSVQRIFDAQEGAVYTQGGDCTSRTLKALEARGLIEIIEDQSGVGTGFGAFPSKVKILNY